MNGVRRWVVALGLLVAAGLASAEGHAETARERAAARARSSHRQAIAEREARDRATVADAEAYMDQVREQNAAEIEAGKADIFDYAREHRPETGFREEVIVQETWRYDPELDDQVMDWQYRLVYKDSRGNVQYEAYFDQAGNLTTPFRESPWRVASRAARDGLRGEADGTLQTRWVFDTDNFGREYPSRVIIQGGGVNRVQMSFNETGTAWFWDLKDEDGRPIAYGQGTQKPQYTDPGGALAGVTPPRPGTGPCLDPDCRELLEARNEVVAEMATLASQINQIADTHARLGVLAAEEQMHVDTRNQRARYDELRSRYEALKPSYQSAHAAWMACEEPCKKPGQDAANLVSMGGDAILVGASTASAQDVTVAAGLSLQVVLDSGLLCHFGGLGVPLVAIPVGPGGLAAAPGESPGASTTTQPSSTTSGSPSSAATPVEHPSQVPTQATNAPSPTTDQPSSTTETPGATTTTNPHSSTAGGSAAGSPVRKPSVPYVPLDDADEPRDSWKNEPWAPYTPSDDSPRDTWPDPSDPKQVPEGSVVLIIKSSAAATVAGVSSTLLVVPPAATEAFAMPTDSCGGSTCDVWKYDTSCSDQWFCDQGATPSDALGSSTSYDADCRGSDCPGSAVDWRADCTSPGDCTYTFEDTACTEGACEYSCEGPSCGMDVGFDQGPVKCEVAAGGSCQVTIPPSQLQAGKYFLSVIPTFAALPDAEYTLGPVSKSAWDFTSDALGASGAALSLNESASYEIEVDGSDYSGYSLRVDPEVLDLAPTLEPWFYAPVEIQGDYYASLLFPTALQVTIDAALEATPGIFEVEPDLCFIMWSQ